MTGNRDLLEQSVLGPEAYTVGNHESYISCFTGLFHLDRFVHVERHRLFTQNMLLMGSRLERKLAVTIRWEADVNDVDFIGQRIKVGKEFCAMLVRKRLPAFG